MKSHARGWLIQTRYKISLHPLGLQLVRPGSPHSSHSILPTLASYFELALNLILSALGAFGGAHLTRVDVPRLSGLSGATVTVKESE